MHRLALLVLLAGCPAKKPVTPPPQEPGVGCPAAKDVLVASYVSPPQGEQGHAGWVLPLHLQKDVPLGGLPGYTQVQPQVAQQAGVPQPPPVVWLVQPGAPACKATPGSYYAAVMDAPSSISYGVELTGCPPPLETTDAVAIALASSAPPSECKIYPPRPIAARLGEIDKQNVWSRPTKDTPIPAAFLPAIPQRACAAPDCEMLWSIAQVEIDGKPVAWAGAVNWLEIPPGAPPASQCTWKSESFSGFFIAGPDGAPVKISDAQDHPLLLTAVLADKSGPHVVLAEGTGEYTAYDLAGGAATVGRHLVWLQGAPEDYGALDKLGPDCSQSAQ